MSAREIEAGSAKLGFLGLGHMGSGLTRRLRWAGWTIAAWNRSAGPAQALKADGVAIAGSLKELVAGSDAILSCLANDAAVSAVYFGAEGVFSAARAGTIVLEMSTISPELSVRLHEEAARRGVRLLDVAISGSTPAVEAGTITLLAGGDRDTFAACVPIYRSIARQWYLIGPGASGVKMKLVVNLLLGVGMAAIAEAISLGEHMELNRDVLLDVMAQTAVVAPAYKGKFEKIRNNDYSAEFPLHLMSKDMNLAIEHAEALGADVEVAKAAQEIFAENVAGSGDLDLSAITPFVVKRKAEGK